VAFTIRIKPGANNAKLIRKLNPASVDLAMARALNRFALFVFRGLVIKGQSLTKRRTGTLNRSWKVTPLKRGLSVINRAKTAGGKFYARFLEFGTKAHDIKPKKGRVGLNGRPPALAWRKSGQGPQSSFKGKFNPDNFFFSKGHRVKGIKAKRIVLKTLNESVPAWAKFLNEELRKELAP